MGSAVCSSLAFFYLCSSYWLWQVLEKTELYGHFSAYGGAVVFFLILKGVHCFL